MKTEIKSITLEKECEISGFIETTREQKTMLFIVLRDRSGKIQIAIEKSKMPEMATKLSSLLSGSVIRVKGKAISAPAVTLGGIEFVPSEIEIESKAAASPISTDSSIDHRLEYRWIDLRDEKRRHIFEIRSFVESKMREFFVSKGFIEIHTPKISAQCSEGGAEVFGIDYYGQKAYLTQSPQFYKQMAIAAGFEKVFEIGAQYRAEKSFTARHAAESVAIDFEIVDVKSHHEICDIEDSGSYSRKQNSKNKTCISF